MVNIEKTGKIDGERAKTAGVSFELSPLDLRIGQSDSRIRLPHDPNESLELLKSLDGQEVTVRKQAQFRRMSLYLHKTIAARRSPFQTSIMLLGESGSGKSSTINHLLNAELATTSAETSETRAVTEYFSTTSINELEFDDVKLSIIDTPGFNDTGGIDQDACNLWAIRRFWDEKKSQVQLKSYSNVILLCINAIENRYEGPSSRLTRSLKILNDLNIIDREKPNLVIALTHACAIAHVNVKEWKKQLESKKNDFLRILKTELGIGAPIVFIENRFQSYNIEEVNEESTLPDGTRQPSNLFNVIMDLLKKNGDELGYITVREFYRKSARKCTFTKGVEVKSKAVQRKGSSLNDHEEACREALLKTSDAWLAFQKELKKRELESEQQSKAKEEELNRELEELAKSNPQLQTSLKQTTKTSGNTNPSESTPSPVDDVTEGARKTEAEKRKLPSFDSFKPDKKFVLTVLLGLGVAGLCGGCIALALIMPPLGILCGAGAAATVAATVFNATRGNGAGMETPATEIPEEP